MTKRTNRKTARRQPGSAGATGSSRPGFPGDLQAVKLPGRRSGSAAVEPAGARLARYNEARLAAAAAREPLDYRMTHRALEADRDPAVVRFGLSLPDAVGDIGNPHRSYDTLATLRRNGSIAGPEYDAGRAFEEDFIRARLEPLHASNPARMPGRGPAELSDLMVAGRRRVGSAMSALGGTVTPAGSAIWCILGGGLTVKEWAAKCQFGEAGRSLDQKVAKGIFLGALGVLAVHYGTLRRRRRDPKQAVPRGPS